MKYHIKNPKTEEIVGPFSIDEILSQLQNHKITEDSRAHEASGQSYTALRHSDDWFPVSQLSSQSSAGGNPIGQAARATSSVESRYRDAYLVASAVAAIGAAVKVIGVVVGLLVLLAGVIAALNSSGNSIQLFIDALLLGIIVAIPIFVLGVLVSAQGQILKATLDTAVHGSPFLTKDEMARVMSL